MDWAGSIIHVLCPLSIVFLRSYWQTWANDWEGRREPVDLGCFAGLLPLAGMRTDSNDRGSFRKFFSMIDFPPGMVLRTEELPAKLFHRHKDGAEQLSHEGAQI